MADSDFTQPASPDAAAPYTADQYRTILQIIAGRCATLEQLLCQAQSAEDFAAEIALDAAMIVAISVGAMADDAVNPGIGEIIGNHNRWNFGPNFDDAGKAVQG